MGFEYVKARTLALQRAFPDVFKNVKDAELTKAPAKLARPFSAPPSPHLEPVRRGEGVCASGLTVGGQSDEDVNVDFNDEAFSLDDPQTPTATSQYSGTA